MESAAPLCAKFIETRSIETRSSVPSLTLDTRFDSFESIEGSSFFGADVMRGLGPDEGLRGGISAIEVVQDCRFEIGDAGEGAASDAFCGEEYKMGHSRIRVAILFGGRSAEHDVSRESAANVLRALNPDRYEVTLIGITRDGAWILADAGNGAGLGAAALTVPSDGPQLTLLEGGQGRALIFEPRVAEISRTQTFDVLFPVLHGPNGEDGTIQGALELSNVAYVGSGVLGSAAAMDKDVAKRLMRDAGLPIVPFLVMPATSPIKYENAMASLGTPDLFIKPANMGSSVGVSRASNASEFEVSCELALRFDRKILIEQCVPSAREIECSVLEDENGNVTTSQLGEIVTAEKYGFYSYAAKYLDLEGATLRLPADVPSLTASRIRELAIDAFNVLCCEALARIDFFLSGEDVFINEVNTLPGFTNISMYPKLWELSGLPQAELMDKLIAHALLRQRRSRGLSNDRGA